MFFSWNSRWNCKSSSVGDVCSAFDFNSVVLEDRFNLVGLLDEFGGDFAIAFDVIEINGLTVGDGAVISRIFSCIVCSFPTVEDESRSWGGKFHIGMWVIVVFGAFHRPEVGAPALDRIGIADLVSCLVEIVDGVDWTTFD